jgi:hypothetical protein
MLQSTDVKLSDIQPWAIRPAELPPEFTERIKAFKGKPRRCRPELAGTGVFAHPRDDPMARKTGPARAEWP